MPTAKSQVMGEREGEEPSAFEMVLPPRFPLANDLR